MRDFFLEWINGQNFFRDLDFGYVNDRSRWFSCFNFWRFRSFWDLDLRGLNLGGLDLWRFPLGRLNFWRDLDRGGDRLIFRFKSCFFLGLSSFRFFFFFIFFGV